MPIQLSAVDSSNLGTLTLVSVQPTFVGRAILFPDPNTAGQYLFVFYVTQSMGPVAVSMPNVQGLLYADLPDGITPTLFADLNTALAALPPNLGGPSGPTGNDTPPHP